MSEIFISYARTDRARAACLAQTLGLQGWSVWWDRDIPPGKTFDEVIEEALANARCVIVLWSHESVQSEWVKAEASEAAKRRILVPILADEAKIPLEFRRIQAARLTDWNDLTANADWDQLEQALTALTGQRPLAGHRAPKAQRPERRHAAASAAVAPWKSRGAVALAGIVVLLLVVAVTMFRTRESEVNGSAGKVAVTPPTQTAPSPSLPSPSVVNDVKNAVAPQPPAPGGFREATPPRRPAVRPAEAVIPAPEPLERPSPGPRGPTGVVADATDGSALIATSRTPEARAVPAPRVDSAPAPKRSEQASFEVVLTYGVFRNQNGRLTISSDGVRYQGIGGQDGSRAAIEMACGEIRKVEMPNRIADGEQRMLELGLRDRSYRFASADTAGRDAIVSALSRICGPL